MNYTEYDVKVLPPVFLALVIVAVLLGILLRKAPVKYRAIPTAVVAIVILFLEVIKQRWNILGEFDTFSLPFHYCSLFIVMFAFAELCGKRMSKIFRPIAMCMAFIVSVGMYLFPYAIIGNATEVFGQSFYRTHSFLYHHFVLFYLLLVIALRLAKPTFRDAIKVGVVGMVYMAAAIPLAYALETNYNNILENAVPFIDAFRQANGQVVYVVLLTVIVSVGTFLASCLYVGIEKGVLLLLKKCKEKRQKSK